MRKLIIHPKDKSTDFLKVIYAGRDDCTVITDGTFDEVKDAIRNHDHIIMMGHGTPQGLLAVNQFRDKPLEIKPGKVTTKPVAKTKQLALAGDDMEDIEAELNELAEDWYEDSKLWPETTFDSLGKGHFKGKTSGGSSYRSSSYSGYSSNYINKMTSTYVIDDSYADMLRGKKLTTIWCNADQFIEWNKLDGFYTGMFISEKSEASLIGTASADQWQIDESNYGFTHVVRRFIDEPAEVLHAALKREYGEMAKYNPVAKYNYRRLYVAGESNVLSN